MSREAAIAVMIGAGVLILAAMVWGWRRRTRRDAGLSAPLGDLPAGAPVLAIAEGLYVATTRHAKPLDRIAIRPLAFRSRMTLTVTAGGVALDLPGAPRVVLPVSALRATGRATVAIDRVVEPDGLAYLTWAVTEDTLVDSYFRIQSGDPADLLRTIDEILPRTATTPTGTES